MCGIAGIIHLDHTSPSLSALKDMTDALSHRGPDGEGQFIDGPVGFGHRRLSIIDLSSRGKQPMVSEDGEFVLTYNGEIYNFKELRSELRGLGHQFHSDTDSEVVLCAWRQWGSDCVNRFNGMFAFAVWDKPARSVYLVRDRYGIKPLYWSRWGSVVLFGSEQKGLFPHPECRRELDYEALLEYFTFQNLFTNRTLLKNIQILPPATIARIRIDQLRDPEFTTYWDFDFTEPEGRCDHDEYREELDRLMSQAVSRQLISDVELGSYLSGGMDSGTLTALASADIPNMKTFTCGFDLSSASGLELNFDERQKAEAMSAFYKTEHYEMVLKSGDMERVLPRLAFHLEEPRVGQSYPNYYAAQLASKFVKVVLSGTGGDELFGGYPWRYYSFAGSPSFEHYVDQYYLYWQRLIDNTTIQKVFAPISEQVSGVWTRDIFQDVFGNRDVGLDNPQDLVNHSLYFECKTFLHGLLLVEDKLSMAHGLETRVPFLDNDLVDFAMRCPVRFKVNNLTSVQRLDENDFRNKPNLFFEKTNDGKQILRDAMSRYLPDSVSSAPKQGFSAPDESWFKGESIDFVRSKLLYGDPKIYQFMDGVAVKELINEHLSGKANRRLLIWSLLNVEQWIDEFLDVRA